MASYAFASVEHAQVLLLFRLRPRSESRHGARCEQPPWGFPLYRSTEVPGPTSAIGRRRPRSTQSSVTTSRRSTPRWRRGSTGRRCRRSCVASSIPIWIAVCSVADSRASNASRAPSSTSWRSPAKAVRFGQPACRSTTTAYRRPGQKPPKTPCPGTPLVRPTRDVPPGGAFRDFHGGGSGPLLCGTRSQSSSFMCRSITSDQVVAKLHRGKTTVESLVLRAQPSWYLSGSSYSGRQYISYGDGGAKIQAQTSPQIAFKVAVSGWAAERLRRFRAARLRAQRQAQCARPHPVETATSSVASGGRRQGPARPPLRRTEGAGAAPLRHAARIGQWMRGPHGSGARLADRRKQCGRGLVDHRDEHRLQRRRYAREGDGRPDSHGLRVRSPGWRRCRSRPSSRT
jgi:hypothetical protein